MQDPTDKLKTELRAEVHRVLKRLTAAGRAEASVKARHRLVEQARWRQAGAVLLYAPLADELDLWPLVAEALTAGKLTALPRFDTAAGNYAACQISNLEGDIRPGKFGIREPAGHCPLVALNRLDLALVPGVAFDLDGNRLGRGTGFYDRMLAGFRGFVCGAAFDQQVVARVPAGPHDIRLSCLLTPTRWHVVTGPRAVPK